MGWLASRTWQDEIQERIARQLAELQHEVAALGKSVARTGGHIQEDAGDLSEALWHGGEMAAQQFSKGAVRLGRAARENPVPVVVAVVAAIGVIAALSLAFGHPRD